MQPNDFKQPNPRAKGTPAGGMSTADVAAAGEARAAETRAAEARTADVRSTETAATRRGLRADTRTDSANPTDASETLFPANQTGEFRNRWTDIQASFVDEPRQAVEQADSLVAEVVQKLAASFATERSKLEKQWDTGDNVSTEDLRVAVRRYRSFFDKLLSL
jgi:hypothetical protein